MAETSRLSLRILPSMGAVMIGCLMVAERAGLPSQLFTQLFLIVVAAIIGAIALGTRTLDGKQFFRPARGGSATTRGVAIASMAGMGLLPIALPTVWQGDATQGLALALAVAMGGLLYIALIAPALDRKGLPDIARLAVPDQSHWALRTFIYLVALVALLATLGGLGSFFLRFEAQQALVQDSFITRGALALAVAVALLGGRAGAVRLSALALPIWLFAGAGIVAVMAGLELSALRELSNNTLLSAKATDGTSGAMTLAGAASHGGSCMIVCTALGIALGNLGGDGRGPIIRTPLPYFLAMAAMLIIIAALATGMPEQTRDQQFAIYAATRALDLPIVFQAAAAAAVAGMMCAALAAVLFACSSILLRGLAPIFTQRRQADSKQLFRARMLIMLLGAVLAFQPPNISEATYAISALMAGAALTALCLPATVARAFGLRLGNVQLLLLWGAGAIGFASSWALPSTIDVAANPFLSPAAITLAATLGVLAGLAMVMALAVAPRFQPRRKRAMI